jgi:beta-xylosidase
MAAKPSGVFSGSRWLRAVQQAHCYSAITAMEFEPEHFQQARGLVCYYNSSKFHYLHVSHDEEHGRHVRVMSCIPDQSQSDFFTAPIAIPAGRIELRAEVDYERLRFAYRIGGDWKFLPELFDASILSDEAAGLGSANFTGAFVGVACQDLSGTAHPADFDWFEYRERVVPAIVRTVGLISNGQRVFERSPSCPLPRRACRCDNVSRVRDAGRGRPDNAGLPANR